jgi:hypothetical protein
MVERLTSRVRVRLERCGRVMRLAMSRLMNRCNPAAFNFQAAYVSPTCRIQNKNMLDLFLPSQRDQIDLPPSVSRIFDSCTCEK